MNLQSTYDNPFRRSRAREERTRGAGSWLASAGRWVLALAVAQSTGLSGVKAGEVIYVAYDGDGIPHFSNQPYGPGYQAYLQGDSGISHSQPYPRTAPGARQAALIPAIQEVAREQGVDPALIRAVAAVESGYHPKATSPKGAAGVMQLLPSTARQYGVGNLHDARQNLAGGTRYLKDLLAVYQGNLPLALAAYNAGQRNVSKHHQRIPPYIETMLYVPQVLAKMEEYRRQAAGQP